MDKVYKSLGLAKRAGKVKSGEKNCKDAIISGMAYLVILAEDISKNTHKNITDSCKYYNVEYVTFGNMLNLGHAIGNDFNACVAVCDEGLAGLVKKNLLQN